MKQQLARRVTVQVWLKLHDGDRGVGCLGQNGSGGVAETWYYWDTKGQGDQASLQQTLRLWVLRRDPQTTHLLRPPTPALVGVTVVLFQASLGFDWPL